MTCFADGERRVGGGGGKEEDEEEESEAEEKKREGEQILYSRIISIKYSSLETLLRLQSKPFRVSLLLQLLG